MTSPRRGRNLHVAVELDGAAHSAAARPGTAR